MSERKEIQTLSDPSALNQLHFCKSDKDSDRQSSADLQSALPHASCKVNCR